MSGSGIPEPVRQFLLAHIDSVEQLEVLLLLRASPARHWTAEGVNHELGSSVASIRDRLAVLAAKGLVTTKEDDGRLLYRYEPAEALRGLVDSLAAAYRERRLSVIDLIYARPESDAISFSDAFKLSRAKEGG